MIYKNAAITESQRRMNIFKMHETITKLLINFNFRIENIKIDSQSNYFEEFEISFHAIDKNELDIFVEITTNQEYILSIKGNDIYYNESHLIDFSINQKIEHLQKIIFPQIIKNKFDYKMKYQDIKNYDELSFLN